MHAGDERRLTGYAALPFNLNPYLRTFGDPVLAAGTILPAAGAYDIVFDSRSAASAGKFAFRFWLNDSTPPAVALKTKRVKLGTTLRRGGHGSRAPGSTRPRWSSWSTERAPRQPGGRHGSCPDRGTRQGQAYAAFPGLRLPGDEEHGERRPDPAEHAHPADDLRRQLKATIRCRSPRVVIRESRHGGGKVSTRRLVASAAALPVILAAGVWTGLGGAGLGAESAAPTGFTARLNGAQEVPKPKGVKAGAQGTFTATLVARAARAGRSPGS